MSNTRLHDIFSIVDNNPLLLDLLEIATSPPGKVVFIETLVQHLPPGYLQSALPHSDNKSPQELFKLFTSSLGEVPDYKTTYSRIAAAVEHRKKYFLEYRHKYRAFLFQVGLDWTEARKRAILAQVITSDYESIAKSSILS